MATELTQARAAHRQKSPRSGHVRPRHERGRPVRCSGSATARVLRVAGAHGGSPGATPPGRNLGGPEETSRRPGPRGRGRSSRRRRCRPASSPRPPRPGRSSAAGRCTGRARAEPPAPLHPPGHLRQDPPFPGVEIPGAGSVRHSVPIRSPPGARPGPARGPQGVAGGEADARGAHHEPSGLEPRIDGGVRHHQRLRPLDRAGAERLLPGAVARPVRTTSASVHCRWASTRFTEAALTPKTSCARRTTRS